MKWISAGAIFCAMVIIHEFGHFIVGKLLGFKIETFSVGFGPRLFGFKIGETDYRFSAIPLGGYVKFAGENMEMIQGQTASSHDEFFAQAKWKRLLVAFAGPVFNIVTAILIPAVAILIGFRELSMGGEQIVVGRVLPGSAAEIAGLQKGDRITAYGEKQNPNWSDFQLDVMLHPNQEVPLTVDRNGQVIRPTVKLQSKTLNKEEIGTIGIEPFMAGVSVLKVTPNMPAEKAGLRDGDKILAINDVEISSYPQFKDLLRDSKGEAINIKVARGEQTLMLPTTPTWQDNEWRLGFRPDLTRFVKTDSIPGALSYAVDYNWRILRVTGIALKQVIVGERSARNTLGGPVRIAEQAADTYDAAGWAGTLELMGMLSLNLGVFNLLPIPVLDGGVIMMILVEALFGLLGLSLTMNIRERVQQVGFVMVLLLMGFVFINDFIHVGERWFSKPPAQEQTAPSPGK